MPNNTQPGPILIHRADILSGLRALLLAQQRFDRHLKEDSYACGYREGFEDALDSIAQLLGVAEEFDTTRQSQLPDRTPRQLISQPRPKITAASEG